MQYIYLFHLIIWMNQKYYLSLQQKNNDDRKGQVL